MSLNKNMYQSILRLIIINFLFFITVYSQAQTNGGTNLIDAKGRKQGVWRKYYSNNRLRFTGKFINNHPVDTFKFYYESGKLKGLKIYSEKTKLVPSFMFYEDSTLMMKGFYRDTIKDSTWIYYVSKVPIYIVSYKNGKKNGVAKTFNREGKILEEITWKNDLKEGPWNRFHPDGKLYIKSFYQKNKINGIFQAFNGEGTLLISGIYKDNLKNNLWIYYTDKGQIGKRDFYINGTLVKEELLIKPLAEDTITKPNKLNPVENEFNNSDIDR